MKNKTLALCALAVVCLAGVASAEPTGLAAVEAGATSMISDVVGYVGGVIVAAFAVFGLIWGVGRIKSGISAGS